MDIKKLEINKSCWFEVITFGGEIEPMISLEYVEHSPAHGYVDSETSVDIDKEMATKIIEFLKEAISEPYNPPGWTCTCCGVEVPAFVHPRVSSGDFGPTGKDHRICWDCWKEAIKAGICVFCGHGGERPEDRYRWVTPEPGEVVSYDKACRGCNREWIDY